MDLIASLSVAGYMRFLFLHAEGQTGSVRLLLSTIDIIIAVIIRCRILKYFDSQETDHSQETDPALVIEFSVCA